MCQRLRNWCFTILETEENGISKEELKKWTSEERPDEIGYCIYQIERCPTTSRRHIQGYVELTKSVRLNAVKRLFNNTHMHLEARKGSRDAARDYCKKEDTREDGPYEIGA